MAQQTINNNDQGQTARNKINSNFAELYNALPGAVLKAINTGTSFLTVPANTWVERIVVSTASGTPSIQIGTTEGGQDILPMTPVINLQFIFVQTILNVQTSYYFTVTDGTINIRIDQLSNYY